MSRLLPSRLCAPRAALTALRSVINERLQHVGLHSTSNRTRSSSSTGHGEYSTLNDTDGLTDTRYFDRESFHGGFESLCTEGLFVAASATSSTATSSSSLRFESLTNGQAIADEDFVEVLLVDIRDFQEHKGNEPHSLFAEFVTPEYRELLSGLKVALVIPQ